jgi:transposase
VLDEEECIDATFVMAKGGGAEVGTTKRGKGMKIMAIVDRHGLPLAASTHAANHHEVRLVQLCFDFYMIEAKPKNLIADRAYDSDPLDEELRRDGIEMIAPHRTNRRKPPTQDRPRLSRYKRRWLVERFFAWIQWQSGPLGVSCRELPRTAASLSSSNDFEIGSTKTHESRSERSDQRDLRASSLLSACALAHYSALRHVQVHKMSV